MKVEEQMINLKCIFLYFQVTQFASHSDRPRERSSGGVVSTYLVSSVNITSAQSSKHELFVLIKQVGNMRTIQDIS